MTLEEIRLLIAEGDPLMPKDLTPEQVLVMLEQQEQVRQQCAAQFSSSPLHQARAAKDPDYWKNFSPGMVKV